MSEVKPSVYWLNKCDRCIYAKEFQMKPNLYWHCDRYQLPMYAVKGKCPDGIYYDNRTAKDGMR